MSKLDPQSQAFLAKLAAEKPTPWFSMPVPEARDGYLKVSNAAAGKTEAIHRVDEIELGGCRCRLYDDTPNQPSPTVIYFHGGGWVLGDIDTHDVLCRRLAKLSQCTLISVDYRRSPEAQHPIPIEDCFSATCDAVEQATAIGIDAQRMAVAGDSAGGYLAAQVARRISEAKRDGNISWSLKLQLLIYPVIEPDFETESYQLFAEGHGLTQESMRWFWDQYRGKTERDDASLSPLAAESLDGLPPAHMITASHDVLRDDGIAYAQALMEAGVPVSVVPYEGMLHGFVHMAGLFDGGLQAASDLAQVLRFHLQPLNLPVDEDADAKGK